MLWEIFGDNIITPEVEAIEKIMEKYAITLGFFLLSFGDHMINKDIQGGVSECCKESNNALRDLSKCCGNVISPLISNRLCDNPIGIDCVWRGGEGKCCLRSGCYYESVKNKKFFSQS